MINNEGYYNGNILEIINAENIIDIDKKIIELKLNFNSIGFVFSDSDIIDFLNWYISIKKQIIDIFNCGNKLDNIKNYFKMSNDLLGEGISNITFNYKNLFAVKIPKIEMYIINDLSGLNNKSKNRNKVDGLMVENDIKNNNIIYNTDYEMNIYNFIKTELIILPYFIDKNFLFGIFPLGKNVNITDIKISELGNNDFFSFLREINNKILGINKNNIYNDNSNNIDLYDDILLLLDYKDEHVLLLDNKLKYCDVNNDVIDGFMKLLYYKSII